MDPIISECGCGKSYTKSQWQSLAEPANNRPMVSSDETGTYSLELRNCPCGSTIGVETKV
jgi:hypothetical protein